MVKKLVLQLDAAAEYRVPSTELFILNETLLDIVTKYKNKITQYYKNKLWDKYKKLSNEYENVFVSPNAITNISLYSPVSRSFFKLWEILHDFGDVLDIDDPKGKKCVFLAEGPGGFCEAYAKKRAHMKDAYFGITLRSNNNRNIPDWKIENLHVSYGKDGTGNLYMLDNILDFVGKVGANTVDFITADGGFDFSSDFNSQEELSHRLILSEIYSALLLQKPGGSFLIKLYDCFTLETISLIKILRDAYATLYIIKPLTSRPANSERYILCHGFRGFPASGHKLKALIAGYAFDRVRTVLDVHVDYDTLYQLLHFNLYYTIRQVYYIQRTINYINFFKKDDTTAVMASIIEKHTKKSQRWCEKYGVPSRVLFPLQP